MSQAGLADKSLLQKIFDWEGISFVTLSGFALGAWGVERYTGVRILFLLAAGVLAIKLSSSISGLRVRYRIPAVIVAAAICGMLVNRLNDEVTGSETEKKSRPRYGVVIVQPSISPVSPSATPSPLPALHRTDEFIVTIPFDASQKSRPVASSSAVGGRRNYAFLQLASIGSGKQQEGEPDGAFVARILQFYIVECLHWNRGLIREEMLPGPQGIEMKPGATKGVDVPDAAPYPEERTHTALGSNRFFNPKTWHTSIKDRPFTLPAGSTLSLIERPASNPDNPSAYIVRVARTNYYKIEFQVTAFGHGEPGCENALPHGFKAFPDRAPYIKACPLTVNLDYVIERGRPGFVVEDYEEWARSFLAYLRNKLADD